MSAVIWESDSMEPAIEFGDMIEVRPTRRIVGDGVYMLRVHGMEPVSLCAPVMEIIRRVKNLPDGRISLTSDNDLYQGGEDVFAELPPWCEVVGMVEVAEHNHGGFWRMAA